MYSLLPFEPFSQHHPTRIYYNGFLPHWRQAGCTYFVTFRLADSIPTSVLNEWKYERDAWLRARGIDASTPNWSRAIQSLSREDRMWLERNFAGKMLYYLNRGHGECLLRAPEVAELVAESLLYFQNQRVTTGDFVVMPNHVHALMTPLAGFELEQILHSIKSYNSTQINKRLKRFGKVWMRESYDHIVRNGEELIKGQRYIRNNPSKAKLSAGEFRIHEAEYDLS